jgi:aspartyl protease family protein
MYREAAVVFTVVLGATGLALTALPAPAPRAAPALRASVPPPVAAVAEPAGPLASVGAAQVSKAADGHFWAEAVVDGAPVTARVRFLVDTGATIVALTEADARRLGLNPAELDYGTAVHTAAGETRAARVRLRSISVSGARVDDVDALVVREGLNSSLLGMSYLGRLSRFEATQSALVLRP